MFELSQSFLTTAWETFILFLIPVGGGIPAGVILGDKGGLSWPILCVLYFFSDVVLACAFEPILLWFVRFSKTNPHLSKFRAALIQATSMTVTRYGVKPGPLALIFITFGTDPMTGRSIAFAAGHGFLTGWALTIAGDMIFFMVIMASTLWLNNILGNGTLTAVIILAAMIILPIFFRKIRERFGKKQKA